ncbi:DUF4153 domain-containing protein [Streptosporangium canum]|uniref:DUF4153 domain-containing protein n=1 Tax=Streptosporangium canum TaxID=324952 RepID=UPI0037903ED3
MRQTLRPLDFLGRIKVKLGIVILLAVAAAFVVNEVGINAGYSRNVRVAVAVVLALIMVQLLARGMTKPLREMAAAAQTIAKGRYGLRVTATSRDEVGELARAFNAMAADLGEVDRQRRELVANVSHELRTPITALRAVLENVVDGVSAPDQATLETALAQTERLGRLVAQLLDLSRLESRARLIELEDVGLGPLCDQALREAVLVRDGITARCEVPAGLSVRADPDLLAQVLANLLDNAVRHSPDGGVVVLAADAEGDGVRLRVTDEGPGIPPEDRARAFERFSRLDAGRAADDGGAGLGLAITKEIVELHGGSIHVEEGTGCCIAVGLPGRTTMDDPPDSDLSSPPPPSGLRSPSASEPSGLRPPSAPERHAPPTPEVPPSVHSGTPGPSPVPVAATSAASEVAGPVPPPSGESLPDRRGVPVPVTPESPEMPVTPEKPESPEMSEMPVMSEAASAPGPGLSAPGPGSLASDAGLPAPDPSSPGLAPPGPVSPDPASSGPAFPGPASHNPAFPGPAFPGSPGPGPASVPREFHAVTQPAWSAPEGWAAASARPVPAPRPAPVRNWGAAFLGVILGGIIGLVCAVLPAVAAGVMFPLLGALVGVLITAAGAFVGTVIGATSIPGSGDVWIGHGTPAHPSVPQGLPPGRLAVPRPGERAGRPGPDGAREGLRAGPDAVSAGLRTGPEAAGAGFPPEPGGGGAGPGDARPSQGGVPQSGDRPRPQGGGLPPGEYVAPPLFPRPELPPTARWVLPACAAAGLLAALALPDSAMGLGFVLVAVAVGAVALPAVRKRITPWSATLGAIAYGLVAVAVFRDADWLVGLLLLAGFLLAALALSGAGRGWLGVARGGASVVLGLLPVPWFLAAAVKVKGAPLHRRMVPVLLGGGLTVVLVAVFGALFASADAVFAEAVERLFSSQDWAESVPLRILLFVVFAVVAASAVLVGLRPVAEPKAPDLRIRVSRGLWMTPLIALNLLFGVFVAMQVTVLFGSTRWLVSATGLTYAEYARSGFFQLVVVSVFVLAIVAVASGALELAGRDRWLMAGLLGLLCALTMVILVSALHRLDLYVDAYGFSRLRASVEAAIWWLGGIFALVLVAGAVRLTRRGNAGWFPRALVATTGAALLAFAVWNPDLRVAETQLAVRTLEQIDQDYLGSLGAEAVPALDRLPEPARSCVLRDVVQANGLHSPDPWNGWNLARQQARELLGRRPVLKDVTCPRTLSRLDIPYQD